MEKYKDQCVDNLHNLPRTKLNDFKEVKLLGNDSSGQVYLVKHIRNNFMYAMKVFEKTFDSMDKKILIEYNILKSMNHPFISTLYFSFQTHAQAYLIMQYSPYGDMFTFMGNMALHCFTEKEILFYSSCVLVGLEYLHSFGIVYRDLKLENILIEASGYIRLSDFDLSIYAKDTVIAKEFIKPYSNTRGIVCQPTIIMNDIVGTIYHIAPEIVKDLPYTCVIDWWMFGTLLYEMLYGVSAFNGSDDVEIMDSIVSHNIIFDKTPHKIKPSKEIKTLIKRLLKKNPKKRLGFKGGATEIQDYPFFASINFNNFENLNPPLILENANANINNYYDYELIKNDTNTTYKFNDDSPDLNESNIIGGASSNIWKSFVNVNKENINPFEI